jgi:hypothetical protein
MFGDGTLNFEAGATLGINKDLDIPGIKASVFLGGRAFVKTEAGLKGVKYQCNECDDSFNLEANLVARVGGGAEIGGRAMVTAAFGLETGVGIVGKGETSIGLMATINCNQEGCKVTAQLGDIEAKFTLTIDFFLKHESEWKITAAINKSISGEFGGPGRRRACH